MKRKTLGIIGGLVLALSITGIALAASAPESSATAVVDDSVKTSAKDDTVTPSSSGAVASDTSVTIADGDTSARSHTETSASIEGSTPSTTLADTTTTSFDDRDDNDDRGRDHPEDEAGASTTSTTIDDHDTDYDDSHDDDGFLGDIAPQTFSINGVGNVTVQVMAGNLTLVSSDTPGWEVQVEKADSDELRLRFYDDSSEARLEIELDDGHLEMKAETHSS